MNCHRAIFDNGQSWILRYEHYYTLFKRRGIFLITASNRLTTWSCSGCPLHIFVLPSVIAYVTLDQTWMKIPFRKTPGGGANNRVGGSHSSESLLNQSDNTVWGVTMSTALFWGNCKAKALNNSGCYTDFFFSMSEDLAPSRPNLNIVLCLLLVSQSLSLCEWCIGGLCVLLHISPSLEGAAIHQWDFHFTEELSPTC